MSENSTQEELTNPDVRLAFEQEWVRQEFITQLDHHMKKSGMMRKTLAQKVGKAPANITKSMHHDHNPTINTMVRLALAVGYRINLTLTPFNENQSPKSVFSQGLPLEAWQPSVIVRYQPANDNSERKTWDVHAGCNEYSPAA